MKRAFRIIIAFGLVAMTAAIATAQPAEPQEGCDYFEATGHNLCEPFQEYWTINGALPVFGFPITEAEVEFIVDRQDEYLTQYFERERMEHHPALAGSRYEILLGRLGNDVLIEMGRDWFSFPKGDPNDEHYFPETGHAIGDEFWEYWSSHGLDLGEDGVSFAESLALFGFPISEPAIETNSSGDTVLTQWFERARFELHGDQVLLGLLGNELLALRGGGEPPPPPAPPGEVIAEGLLNPRHLNVGPDGTVYIAEAGAAGDNCVAPDPEAPDDLVCLGATGRISIIPPGGEGQPYVAAMPSIGGPDGFAVTGPHDVMMGDDGILRVLVGLGAPAQLRDQLFPGSGAMLGTLQSWNPDAGFMTVADLAAWEDLFNPDGISDFPVGADSNPYGFTMLDDGGYLVVDAGGNTLLRVHTDGTIEQVALFEPRLVQLPPEFIEPGGPIEIPMASVPTSVEVGPDGAYYVGELTGFPFPVDGANVYRVTPDGDVTVFASGFTAIVDIAFDSSGNLYVVEMAKNGLLGAETAEPDDIEAMTGSVVMVTPGGIRTEIVSAGLIVPGGVDIGADGTIYVTNYSTMPGLGQVVAFEAVVEPPPTVDMTVLASGLEQPRGLTLDADGNLYVAQSGAGGDTCEVREGPDGEDAEVCFGGTSSVEMISDEGQMTAVGSLSSVAIDGEAVGAQDVAMGADGLLYVTMGLGADPADKSTFPVEGSELGWIVRASPGANALLFADIAAHEGQFNPDDGDRAEGGVDSNPYSIVPFGDGWAVTDAGGNDLLFLDAEGDVTNVIVFPDQFVAAPPFLGLPPGTLIPQESVPTGVVVGPDGALYVGELTGFPFAPGTARVWRVTAGGSAQVYATGFTNIIDLAFDSQGNLYVLEVAANSLLTGDPASAVVRVSPDGNHDVVVGAGLTFATGMAIGPDDTFYVSNFGVMPGMGQVVSFTLD